MTNSNSNSNSNGSSNSGSSNQPVVPNKKDYLNSLKSEVASSLNVNLKQGYNGDLTTREAGSVGGEMVKRMINYAENNMSNNNQ